MNDPREMRVARILRACIKEFDLDLQGLNIFTEAATGPYLYTPILAALGGAQKVFAVTADSKYGTKEEVKRQTFEAAARWGVTERLEVLFDKTRKAIRDSDIITNTGFVRPIDRRMISWMKPTAVVPLMWEPWEFRGDDLDLHACREKEILVMGTDESIPPHAMYPYGGFIAMKLLFELGLEGYKTKTLLLGGGAGLGRSIYAHFEQLGMKITWFADSEQDSMPYSQLSEHFWANGANYDVLILAEHANEVCFLGKEGLLTYEQIKQINSALYIGVIAGNVDIEGLHASGLHFLPKVIQPFRYMSYQAYHLGPLPVLELYAAGLKVGEAMARARLQGMNMQQAKSHAISQSPAMDLE